MIYQELSDAVVDQFFRVHRELGPGLLEKCYHNALFWSLKDCGINVIKEKELLVWFQGQSDKKRVVGQYFADLVVDDKILIEVKSCKFISSGIRAQVLNYLHVAGLKVGYVVNFRPAFFMFERLVL